MRAALFSLFTTLASAAVIPQLEPRMPPSLHTLEVPKECLKACSWFTEFRRECLLDGGLRSTTDECMGYCLYNDDFNKCYGCIADNGNAAARELIGPDQVCNKYGNEVFGDATATTTPPAKCKPKETGSQETPQTSGSSEATSTVVTQSASTEKPAAGATLANPGACTDRCKVFSQYKDCLTGQGRSASCMNSCQRLDEINECYKCISESEGGEDVSSQLNKPPAFCSSSGPTTSAASGASTESTSTLVTHTTDAAAQPTPDAQAIATLQTPDECAAECSAFKSYRADCFGNGAKGHGCMAHCGKEEEVNKCYDCIARVTKNDDALKFKGPIQNNLCPKA